MLIRAISLSSKNGALKNVSCDLAQAGVAVVVGGNGSGKSTLARILWGQEQPEAGGCWLFDQPVLPRNHSSLQLLRRRAGVIFQTDRLLENETALQNVLVGLEIASPGATNLTAYATEALLRVGFSASLHAKPRHLSKGQRQLVAIARAVCTNPELIIADDPTALLGANEAERVLDLLALMQKNGTGLFLTSADARVLSFAQTADWPVYRLLQGELMPVFLSSSKRIDTGTEWKSPIKSGTTSRSKSQSGLIS